MPTIKQIAQKAGVSPTTVSNVLNGRTAKVSPDTLRTVQSVLDTENYTPNLAAQILAHKKSHIIGVIVYHVPRVGETAFEDPFTSTILGAFEEEIRRQGYYMMVHVTHSPEEVMRLAKTWKLDGLLILWLEDKAIKLLLDSSDTPIVFLDSYYDGSNPNFYNVGLDDFTGGYIATKYLIKNGHKNIAVVTDDENITGGYKQRILGYEKALKDSNIVFNKKNIIQLGREREHRFYYYKNICNNQEAYTALFFLADFYAAEAVSYFHEHNVKVPEHFSVIGFDDNIYSKIVHPQLTTVHQDIFNRATTAVTQLLKRIKGYKSVEKRISMDVKLVVRDSVKSILS